MWGGDEQGWWVGGWVGGEGGMSRDVRWVGGWVGRGEGQNASLVPCRPRCSPSNRPFPRPGPGPLCWPGSSKSWARWGEGAGGGGKGCYGKVGERHSNRPGPGPKGHVWRHVHDPVGGSGEGRSAGRGGGGGGGIGWRWRRWLGNGWGTFAPRSWHRHGATYTKSTHLCQSMSVTRTSRGMLNDS